MKKDENEIDEATLLKDWDFARFFPSKFSTQNQETSIANKIVEKSKNEKTTNVSNHRRMESDSKVGGNPFLRGFRRENSDFFPLSSSRHSAIFVDRNANPLRSSGIFNNRRSSDAGINKKMIGEPILTEFIKRNADSPSSTSSNEKNKPKRTGIAEKSVNALKSIGVLRNENVVKPRREKTESDIVLRNSEARKSLRENLESRRRDIESQFLREADNIRKRNSRPIDVNSVALSTTTNSIDGEEYVYFNQVIFSL